MSDITYSLLSGTLPPGFTLEANGAFYGTTNASITPTWVTAGGRLVDTNELESVAVTLVATPIVGHTITDYGVVQATRGTLTGIPWGLVLDSTTGAIQGVLQRSLNPLEQPFNNDELPSWNTTTTNLGTFAEFAVYSGFTFSATPRLGTAIASYMVMSEGIETVLPEGLILDTVTGVLAGTFTEVADGSVMNPTPHPTWNTNGGMIGFVDEGQAATFTLQATANLGTAIASYTTVETEMNGPPPGFYLDVETGVISGTAAPIQFLEAVIPIPLPPVYTTGTLLGTYARGVSVGTIQITATVAAGRTMAAYMIQADQAAPSGLLLDSDTGAITGTPSTIQAASITTFAVVAIDSAGGRVERSFIITTT